nr:MAG TPA: hypothetical protein [Caudoviricetes sp.]
MEVREMIILCDGSSLYAEVDVTELKDGFWHGTWNGHNLTFHGGTWMELLTPKTLRSCVGTINHRKKYRIMTTRQILRTSTIIVLGNLQLLPCILIVSSTINTILLGFFYIVFLFYFWSSTKIGRGFSRNYLHETERLEKYLFGSNAEC